MKRLSWFAVSILVIIVLTFGMWAGHRITAAYKDVEIMNAQVQLDAAKKETAWWQGVLTRLAEGGQIEGVQEKMRGKSE